MVYQLESQSSKWKRKPVYGAVMGGIMVLGAGNLQLAAASCSPCAAKNPCAAARACNPCAAKKACNPCNPCAAKKACNPCNPCAAKKACNPCNPCAAKKACNPCNPCAAKKACNPCNPCAAKKACNPCNPCAAKKACNPCNPCAAKKACNPCNPCAAKKACNPCNPCAATKARNPCAAGKVAARRFKRPQGLRSTVYTNAMVAEGEKLWNDKSLGKSGLACGTCHAGGAALNATFAKAYPHEVAMPSQMAGVGAITADEMVQFCMVVPMQAEPLPWAERSLNALTAYTLALQKEFAANPCRAKSAANPCNPCNPCAAKKKSPCNPCNPCAAKKAS